jgi:S-formylglutathione hydrolase
MMSACCMTPPSGIDAGRAKQAETLHSPEEVNRADFGMKVVFASAAAWSPNPNNPPLYVDLPTKDGQLQQDVLARWTANAPLAMIDQYVGNLRRMRAIGFDVGTKDGLAPASKTLDEVLTAYKIPHKYETYDGDHLSGVEQRLETTVFRFFSESLTFQRE